jgi:hypothetical protein
LSDKLGFDSRRHTQILYKENRKRSLEHKKKPKEKKLGFDKKFQIFSQVFLDQIYNFLIIILSVLNCIYLYLETPIPNEILEFVRAHTTLFIIYQFIFNLLNYISAGTYT